MHTALIWHPSRLPPNVVLERAFSKYSSAHNLRLTFSQVKNSRSYLYCLYLSSAYRPALCVHLIFEVVIRRQQRRAAISPGRAATCGIFLWWIINSRGPLSISSVIIHYHTRSEKLKVIVIMRASAMHPQWDESRRDYSLFGMPPFPGSMRCTH